MSSEGFGSRLCSGRWLILICASVLALASAEPALGNVSAPPRAPARITTLVLNGTHRIGLASRVSGKLASLGIETRQLEGRWVADAPQQVRLTTIFVDLEQRDASSAARRLLPLLGRAVVVKPMPLQIRRYADRAGRPMTVIVLGSSYAGVA
jgi:hypothetical protein